MRYVWGFICFRALRSDALRFSRTMWARHLEQKTLCTSNSKHIVLRHGFLRELVFKGGVVITHVESEEQHANFLTKPLNNTVCR